MRIGLVAGLLLMAAACATGTHVPKASAADCLMPKGEWRNQLGSTLDIQSIDSATGKVEGRYMTASGAGGWFPLVGWINKGTPGGGHNVETVIAFTVRWDSIGSITAWTGYCDAKAGTPTLTTLWHLARPSSGYEWDHILTNSDIFTPK